MAPSNRHIIPIAHEAETSENNLALACARCNLSKGSNLSGIDPISGRIVPLFHPRRQQWKTHFELEGATIVGRTPTGRASVRLLRMNEPERVNERLRLQAIDHYPAG
ncbi:MAG: HNH endonuclease [Anaerolineales bacterium]|uniref:HNH endonuclease signature motif containing protein n=1 Tax=Promineifilum sp. TaxID=2664178 RepID=UPI001E0F0A85|nr:HNH endonuclease [Anaerolineales bacterium]MCO5181517.1 HNH endonuclease [Promineifilum sp.]